MASRFEAHSNAKPSNPHYSIDFICAAGRKLRGDTSPHAIRRQSRYPQAKRLGIAPPYGTAEIHHKTLATMRQLEVLPGNEHDLGFFMSLNRFAAAACFGETTGRFPGARRHRGTIQQSCDLALRHLQRRRSPRIFCTQSLAGSPLCFFTMRSPAFQTHFRLLHVSNSSVEPL